MTTPTLPDMKDYDWAALVREAEGERFLERPIAYIFNEGKREFKNLEENAGVYTP